MTDVTLTETEIEDLRCLAGMIVSASAKFGVPGADDPAIFGDIIESMAYERDDIRATLEALSRLAGAPLADVAPAQRESIAARLRNEGGSSLGVLTRHVLLCYYRDDRVMRSLGIEPRAPFPKGYILEQGDWSLLDPVKARAPFWRRTTSKAGPHQ